MRKYTVIAALLMAGISLGWLSARFMMQNAAGAGVTTDGGWVEITLTTDSLRSTYESGYYLWQGKVPPPNHVRLFRRAKDDEGNFLRGDCAIQIEGTIPEARWWVVNTDSASPSGAVSAGTAIREANGEVAITLSPSPVPGNWIKPGAASSYTLQLVLQNVSAPAGQKLVMPAVKRLWC